MNKPSLDELMSKVDSRYSLVVTAAKRARELTDENPQENRLDGKPVSHALKEVARGKIAYERTKGGIK